MTTKLPHLHLVLVLVLVYTQ